jgi:uncharacterized protein YlzI (FlbEa/FlbD family)
VNAELVQTVEGMPDTVITLTNDVKIIVKEPPEVVIAKLMSYQCEVRKTPLILPAGE